MSLSHNFVKRVLPAVHVGYGHLAAEKSAYNLCMSQVMRSAVMGEHPNVWLDYERVLLGQGPLSVADGVVISQQGCAARVSWRTDIVVGCGDVDDRALLTVYNVNRGVAQFWFRRSLRLDGNCDILFPHEWRGDEVVCYLGFENKEETLCSNMVYVGRCSLL